MKNNCGMKRKKWGVGGENIDHRQVQRSLGADTVTRSRDKTIQVVQPPRYSSAISTSAVEPATIPTPICYRWANFRKLSLSEEKIPDFITEI